MARQRAATELEKTVSTQLKRLRLAAGLSQSELAQRAGVPVGSLRGWEQARRTMMLDAAIKVADALGCTLDELVGRQPPPRARTR